MLERLQRAAFNRALRAGSRPGWIVLAAAVWLARTAFRLSRRSPEVVFSEELGPGQRLVIEHTTLQHGRRRRGIQARSS